MITNSIKILGSGTSTGTPVIGCPCTICNSLDPKDKRLRTSFLLTTSTNKKFLVETTPDLRYQLLENDITKIDAAIISHDHADHLHGIDDLRPLCFDPLEAKIPVFCEKKCAKTIRQRFSYIFDNKPLIGGGIPLLTFFPLKIKNNQIRYISIQNEVFYFFKVPHGRCHAMGFIHQNFAYIPDCSFISEALISFLRQKELRLLLITCLQDAPHETHLTTDQCFSYIKQIAPSQALLIHMNHNLSHQDLSLKAKSHFSFPVSPAYDGAKYHY